MYLEHFKFNELPFALTPNVGFFCQLKGHQEALNTLLFSLRCGEGFIKIIGEVGSGKTLLCKKLLNNIDNDYVTAYIPNPYLSPLELRKALARELGVDPALLHDQHELHMLINNRLLQLHAEGKRVVLLIDEAQALPDETLEAVRLFTNLETNTTKLMQVILFGQPELDQKIHLPHLRQLKQRITFSYFLPKMTREDLDAYLFHRLATAGNAYSTLFSKKSRDLLFKASQGVPRIVNILCHKALLVAYGLGESKITHKIMTAAVKDTDTALSLIDRNKIIFAMIAIATVIALVFLYYFDIGII